MTDRTTNPISVSQLGQALGGVEPPIVIDVRKRPAYLEATTTIQGALRRDCAGVDDWIGSLPAASSFVVYCVHGHEVSQGVARELGVRGLSARYLEGGIAAWSESGGALDRKAAGSPARWVTRERPKIDRIACPWLVARFIDPQAEFVYVPASEVRAAAERSGGIPYDVPGVHFSHEGDRCSFDAFLKHYRLADPALAQLTVIVRAADTARLDLAPQASGLAAISLGLSRNFADDHVMLRHGMVMYDALYAWCKEGKDEVHTWKPQAYAVLATEPA